MPGPGFEVVAENPMAWGLIQETQKCTYLVPQDVPDCHADGHALRARQTSLHHRQRLPEVGLSPQQWRNVIRNPRTLFTEV